MRRPQSAGGGGNNSPCWWRRRRHQQPAAAPIAAPAPGRQGNAPGPVPAEATICVPAGTHTPTSPPGAVVMQKSAAAAPGIHRSLP